MNEIDYNENIAKTYDADRADEEHWLKENNFLLQYLGQKNPKALLDLPVGTGRFLPFYSKVMKVIGIDISEHMLDIARARTTKNGNVNLLVGDACNLNMLVDKSIDMIICFRLFHLITQHERIKIIKEFSRILNGELVLQVYLDPPRKSLYRRLANELRRRVSLLKSDPRSSQKPWSHIKSYSLTRENLMELFTVGKLRVVTDNYLCNYGELDVRVFELKPIAS